MSVPVPSPPKVPCPPADDHRPVLKGLVVVDMIQNLFFLVLLLYATLLNILLLMIEQPYNLQSYGPMLFVPLAFLEMIFGVAYVEGTRLWKSIDLGNPRDSKNSGVCGWIWVNMLLILLGFLAIASLIFCPYLTQHVSHYYIGVSCYFLTWSVSIRIVFMYFVCGFRQEAAAKPAPPEPIVNLTVGQDSHRSVVKGLIVVNMVHNLFILLALVYLLIFCVWAVLKKYEYVGVYAWALIVGVFLLSMPLYALYSDTRLWKTTKMKLSPGGEHFEKDTKAISGWMVVNIAFIVVGVSVKLALILFMITRFQKAFVITWCYVGMMQLTFMGSLRLASLYFVCGFHHDLRGPPGDVHVNIVHVQPSTPKRAVGSGSSQKDSRQTSRPSIEIDSPTTAVQPGIPGGQGLRRTSGSSPRDSKQAFRPSVEEDSLEIL